MKDGSRPGTGDTDRIDCPEWNPVNAPDYSTQQAGGPRETLVTVP